MTWDFSTEPEFQKKLDWVDEFCKSEIEPLGFVFPYAVRSRIRRSRRSSRVCKIRSRRRGLWAIFLDKELGGPGYGQLKLGLLNEVIGRYPSAPQMFGAAAPDTGNMEMLAAYGTEAQKERWLKPMLNQKLWSAYSMTEPQGGSDPKLFKTHAVRDGDEWVINGEKWFTSAGRAADLLFVMCTNGMFVVPRKTPGVEFMPEPRAHNHIKYKNVRVPADHLLGPEGRRPNPRPAQTRRRQNSSRDAHHRALQARVRHDVRAGAEQGIARQGHRRASNGAGEDRRLVCRHQNAAAVRARDGLEDRPTPVPPRREPTSPR